MLQSSRVWLVASILLLGLGAGAIGALVSLRPGRSATDAPRESTSSPRAVVDQPQCNLGVVASPEVFAHTFIIRNEGGSPLLLARGPSNCKCTVTDVPKQPIPPGGQAEVGVSFKLVPKTGPFSQKAKILTNDPEHDTIVLGIEGTVRRHLEAEPASVILSIPFAESRTAETFVYSQIWDRFQLAATKTSRDGMTVRIDPASQKDLKRLEARSAYRVQVDLPHELPDGRFAESIDFSATPVNCGDPPRSLQFQVQGNVYGRMTIHGQKIDDHRILHLGTLPSGQPLHENLILKIHDEHQLLTIRRIETDPKFLRVHVVPYKSGAEQLGLYRIEVDVPNDAWPCNYLNARRGMIRMETDHPKSPAIEIKVDLAVLGHENHAHVAGR